MSERRGGAVVVGGAVSIDEGVKSETRGGELYHVNVRGRGSGRSPVNGWDHPVARVTITVYLWDNLHWLQVKV